MSKKISLALNTLVCSDSYGLGHTIARVQRTSACQLGKVDVCFDEDVDADEFTGRTRTSTDEDGNVTEIRYRTMLVSYLDWDGDDETEEIVVPQITTEDDETEVSATDEIGFDNVEAIEAQHDAEDEALEEAAYAPKPKTTAQWKAEAEKACAHLPGDDADFAERTGQEPSDDEDDAGYAEFLANEFE